MSFYSLIWSLNIFFLYPDLLCAQFFSTSLSGDYTMSFTRKLEKKIFIIAIVHANMMLNNICLSGSSVINDKNAYAVPVNGSSEKNRI